MSLENFTDYKLPKNAYLSFDATSLKSLIIDRLNENETFTDQNFEGSNFSAFIDERPSILLNMLLPLAASLAITE